MGHFPTLSQKGNDEFYNQKLAASLILAIDPIYLTLQKYFPFYIRIIYWNYLNTLLSEELKKIVLTNLSVIKI